MTSSRLILLLSALSAAPGARALSIVATSPDLAWVAKQIAPGAEVAALARGDQDPHQVEPKPSFILKLRKADLLMRVGMDLEAGYLPPLVDQARNPKIQPGGAGLFNAADFVTPLGAPTGKIDRSLGDVHPHGNPHYQLDPENMARIALALGERLSVLDAAGAAAYRANAAALAARLRALRAELVARFKPHAGAPVVIYHNALHYLSAMLGLREVIYLEPLPGIPPSPAQVVKVVGAMKQSGARMIVVENYFSRREADAVAEKSGGRVVVVPISVGGDAQSGDYEALMRRLADLLLAGLA